jgi:hypothetical protein
MSDQDFRGARSHEEVVCRDCRGPGRTYDSEDLMRTTNFACPLQRGQLSMASLSSLILFSMSKACDTVSRALVAISARS